MHRAGIGTPLKLALMELVAVGPDLYACLQPDTGWGASNSGMIDRGLRLMGIRQGTK